MDNKLVIYHPNNSICNFNKIKIPKVYKVNFDKVEDVHLKLLLKVLYESMNIRIQDDSSSWQKWRYEKRIRIYFWKSVAEIMEKIDVVCAIIINDNDEVFCCQRGLGRPL